MKKKLLCILFVLCFSVMPLTSCLLLEGGDSVLNGDRAPAGGTTINVEGGPVYENIEINSNHDKNLLAASRAMLSTVSVICTYETALGLPGGSAGSGVIYKLDKEKGDAYVITNYHVVYNGATAKNPISNDINLFLYGMEHMAEGEVSYAIPATYVGGSMEYDIAVLKVTGSTTLMESCAMAATFADSDKVSVLETAIAIGNPGGGGLSATVGCINVDSENISVQFDTPVGKKAVSLRVMRTDAAVNSGNSGGGLYNDSGELIGIVNAKDADTTVDNIGYAIPSNVAKAIADNAIYYNDGTVKRCLLGITVGSAKYYTEYDVETGKIHKYEKVVITELTDTSAAAGLLMPGDIINSITVDGKKCEVTRIHHVVDAMLYARVGSSVITNVTRDGAAVDVTIAVTQKMLTVY